MMSRKSLALLAMILVVGGDPRSLSPSPQPSLPPSPSPSPAPTPTKGLKATLKFSYTGSVQQWVVPFFVATFTVDAYGAAGGGDNGNGGLGGLGGYISVSNIVASSFVNKTLFIYVGGAGAYNTPGLGGGGYDDYTSGGGATDMRTSFSDLSSRCVFFA